MAPAEIRRFMLRDEGDDPSARREFERRVAAVPVPIGPDVLWLVTVGHCLLASGLGTARASRRNAGPGPAMVENLQAIAAGARRIRRQPRRGRSAAEVERLATWLEDHVRDRLRSVDDSQDLRQSA